MIELLQDLPDNVLALEASSKVTGDDYEKVIIPAVEARFEQFDKIRFLYHLGPDFTGFDAEAMWDDAKVGLKHLTHFEKIAVVTDVDWITRATKTFGFMMPGEVKVFTNAQLAEAKTWVSQ